MRIVHNMNDCIYLQEGVNLIDEFISNKKTFADIKPFAINLCVRVLTEKGYHGDYMCPGIVEAYGPGVCLLLVFLIYAWTFTFTKKSENQKKPKKMILLTSRPLKIFFQI